MNLMPRPPLLGEVALRSNDGEGEDVNKKEESKTMSNFIFISPNFPTNYWQFCREL